MKKNLIRSSDIKWYLSNLNGANTETWTAGMRAESELTETVDWKKEIQMVS